MGRPKTINTLVLEIAVEAVRRIKLQQLADPKFLLSERDAKVIKTLSEAQVILQRRKPDASGPEEDDGKGMSIEELEQQTAEKPATPSPAHEGEDDGPA